MKIQLYPLRWRGIDYLFCWSRCQADGTFNVPKDPYSWPVCTHIVRAPDASGSSSWPLMFLLNCPALLTDFTIAESTCRVLFTTTHVSVEIVLGVNIAMKDFEREQELAAFYNVPKDDRVDNDVEKS